MTFRQCNEALRGIWLRGIKHYKWLYTHNTPYSIPRTLFTLPSVAVPSDARLESDATPYNDHIVYDILNIWTRDSILNYFGLFNFSSLFIPDKSRQFLTLVSECGINQTDAPNSARVYLLSRISENKVQKPQCLNPCWTISMDGEDDFWDVGLGHISDGPRALV